MLSEFCNLVVNQFDFTKPYLMLALGFLGFFG